MLCSYLVERVTQITIVWFRSTRAYEPITLRSFITVFICKPTEVLKPSCARSRALMCFVKALPEWKEANAAMERNAAECLVSLQAAAVIARLHRHEHVPWLLCSVCKLITFIPTEVFKIWESGHRVWPCGPSGPNFRHVAWPLIVSRSVWPGQSKALLNRN